MHFDRFGLAFDFPDDWSIEVDDDESGVTSTSPGGGFWSVSAYSDAGSPEELATAVADQMRQEFRDLDVEPADDEIAGRHLAGYDFNFYCLDLTNTATVRALDSEGRAYVLFCQADDREWDRIAPIFAAMTTSFLRGLAGA